MTQRFVILIVLFEMNWLGVKLLDKAEKFIKISKSC